MLALLHERLPWLRPGALGGPRYVSFETYTVRCSHCLRQPCSHGPYVRLVIGRHRRGKRTRFHIPNKIADVVTAAVRRRQRITAGDRRAVAMLWGHYWQVRLYTPWRWIPTKEWWPTSRLAKLKGAAHDGRDDKVLNQVVAGQDPIGPTAGDPCDMRSKSAVPNRKLETLAQRVQGRVPTSRRVESVSSSRASTTAPMENTEVSWELPSAEHRLGAAPLPSKRRAR